MKCKTYISFCKKECDKSVTKEDVVNSLDCNFCDVPYILLDVGDDEE